MATGSVEGNSKVKSGSLGGDSKLSVVCLSIVTCNSGGCTKCVSVIVYFCSVDNNSGLMTSSVSSKGNFGRSGIG
jgi:hypothetical protein